MYAKAEKPKENKTRAIANSVSQNISDNEHGFGFEDNRLEVVAQRKLQETTNNTPRDLQLRTFQDIADTNSSIKRVNTLSISSDVIVQRQLITSGPDVIYGKQILSDAYKVGLPETEDGSLTFNATGDNDPWGTPRFNTIENHRPEPENDGIGSHLIGKIIDDGNVSIYFGEENMDNVGRPTDPVNSDRGLPSDGQIFVKPQVKAIELIHELIHTYHFAFDPWNAKQKNQDVEINGVHETAEEASTVGLGQWAEFGLTENAFRAQMGLSTRDKYTGWKEPE